MESTFGYRAIPIAAGRVYILYFLDGLVTFEAEVDKLKLK